MRNRTVALLVALGITTAPIASAAEVSDDASTTAITGTPSGQPPPSLTTQLRELASRQVVGPISPFTLRADTIMAGRTAKTARLRVANANAAGSDRSFFGTVPGILTAIALAAGATAMVVQFNKLPRSNDRSKQP
jgi:hypothetical protein